MKTIEEDLINVNKLRAIGTIGLMIKDSQTSSFTIVPKLDVQNWF